jgi:hypothetical protein
MPTGREVPKAAGQYSSSRHSSLSKDTSATSKSCEVLAPCGASVEQRITSLRNAPTGQGVIQVANAGRQRKSRSARLRVPLLVTRIHSASYRSSGAQSQTRSAKLHVQRRSYPRDRTLKACLSGSPCEAMWRRVPLIDDLDRPIRGELRASQFRSS